MNLDKLDAAIAYIEAHPDEHDQGCWFVKRDCGTAACLAGTIAHLDGWAPVWPKQRRRWDLTDAEDVKKNGSRRKIPLVAREILGASTNQASFLFNVAEDLADIKRFRALIVAGELL